MSRIGDNYSVLLSTLQNAQTLSDITFTQGYKKEKLSRPVLTPYCAISNKTSEIYADFYSYQTFELKVFSPLSEDGAGCYEYVNRINEYILNNIAGIVKVKSTQIEYDTNTVAFVACIFVKCKTNIFSALSGGENSPVELTINSSTFNAAYCKVYDNKNVFVIREAWNSNPVDFISEDTNYVITIGSFDICYIEDLEDVHSFTLEFGNAVYTGCRIYSIEYNHILGKVELAKIYAKKKELMFG